MLELNDSMHVIAKCGAILFKLWTFLMGQRNYFNPHKRKNFIILSFFRLSFVLSFIYHAISSHDNNYADHILLYIALFPSLLVLILMNFEYIFGTRSMEVELARNERPNFVLLSIKRDDSIKWECGQYIEINCPFISKYEYHPFFITSSPDSNYINISVLSCGDWTQKLWERYVSENVDYSHPLKVSGPYGIGFDPNKMNYNFDYVVFVATSNGSVEIIASLINHITKNFLLNPKHPIEKIYVYWMVSADDGCYWFYKLLRDFKTMYPDRFLPTIFVTSSNQDDKTNAFGLNFFLALRRESLQTNLMTQQIRLSAGRLSTYRRPVSVFNNGSSNPSNPQSRFHQHLKLANMKQIDNKNNKHGIEIRDNLDDINEAEDISMQSPDFRVAFGKIREELIQKYGNNGSIQTNVNNQSVSPHTKVGIASMNGPIKQNSMHGIVPALVVASGNNGPRMCQVGTFFVGSEILEHRLQILCQQYSDNQVIFEFNSMVIGDNYTNRYST